MTAACVSIILPVYNEEGNIATCLRGLSRALQGLEHEILVCYDFDEDTTLPAIERMEDRPAGVRLVRNTLGRGAAAAIRAGFQAARGDVLVTTMADLSDPPEVIPGMARKIREEGADVVSGSRYMKGGSQTGGPRLKTLLSRAAGLSLHGLAGLGTHDATTNFRAYSRKFIDRVDIRSRYGMELALELTVKAHLGGFRVDEVPSSWHDRSAGESRFKLWTWLPRYLRWYLAGLADPLFVWLVLLGASIAAFVFAVGHAPALPYWDDWSYVPVLTGHEPFSPAWLWAQHYEHRIPLAKLAWMGIARMTGGDARWTTGAIALLLSCSAALLVRGLLRFRGRTVWTDAFVPLLFLHWDHWENLTWPFQIAFAIHTLVLSLIVSLLLRLRRSGPERLALPIGLSLLILPLCGGSALPFAALLASGWILVALRDLRGTPRKLSVVCSAAALLLAALYVVGYRKVESGPPSPGLGATLSAATQFFTGSLGHQGSRAWPASGWVTAAGLLFTLILLLRGSRRKDADRLPARGLLLILGGMLVLSVLVGNSRAGMSPFAGFFDRYVTLSCFLPFLAYAASEFFPRPLPGLAVRIGLACALAFLFVPNARHAWDLLGQRRFAVDRVTRDVRAGVPLPILARRHRAWHPDPIETVEAQFRMLAEKRLTIFRTHPLPDEALRWTAGMARLSDGRIAGDAAPGRVFRPELPRGTHRIRLDFGRWSASTGEVRVRATRGGETIWSDAVGRNLLQSGEFPVEGGRVEIDSTERIWVLLEPVPAP